MLSTFAYRKAWAGLAYEFKMAGANTWEQIADSLPVNQSSRQKLIRLGLMITGLSVIIMVIVFTIIYPLGEPLSLPGRF